MLSILIPIYNFDVRFFVNQLAEQSVTVGFEVEIICLDDNSHPEFLELNRQIADLPNVNYQVLSSNLGRSSIRNRLAEMARFEHLLFLDCDGHCVSENYVLEYAAHFDCYDVIYGGRVYQPTVPSDQQFLLHWYCGKAREEIAMIERSRYPFKTFMTNNFLVRKSVYNQVKMDESISGYGHEDTFFAIQLRQNGFSIKHIDNPLMHIGLESTSVFLQKSENGVRNLALLFQKGKVDDSIKLIRVFQMTRKSGLIFLIKQFYAIQKDRIMKNLFSSRPNLLYFDLWKLVTLASSLR